MPQSNLGRHMKSTSLIFTTLTIVTLSGCASVTGSTTQAISVQSRAPNGKEIKEAQCDLVNKRGTYFISTPGTITISRSNDNLMVTCRKDGFDNGRATVVSDTKGSMFGNILLGGGIGAIVDHNNGSAYEYPSFIQVVMGQDVQIGKPKEEMAQNQNPMMGGAPSSSNPKVVNTKTTAVKLQELKKLRDDGLITQDVYEQRQNVILQEAN